MGGHQVQGGSRVRVRGRQGGRTGLRRQARPGLDRAGRGEVSATPPWFDFLTVVGVSGVLSFGGFGLLLAVLGHYSEAPALLLGGAGTITGTVLGRPRREEEADRSGRSTTA